jgi:hypothetical protein
MKFNFTNKKYLYAVGILVIVDIILLFQNINKQISVKELERQITSYEIIQNDKVFYFNDFFNINMKNIKTKNYKILLICLLDQHVCRSCLLNEIQEINKIYHKYSNNIIVFYSGDPNYLNSLGAKFNYELVEDIQKVFMLPYDIDNPTSLLVDAKGNVYFSHKAINGNTTDSYKYFQKVNSLFQLVYDK